MHDPLHRLYRVKVVLLAVLLLTSGLGLLIFGHWLQVQHSSGWSWIRNWPLTDLGSAAFTTGLLGVLWQYLDGQDSEARDTERLKRVLADSAPAMRDAVIDGFAFEPDDLARVATPEVLDQIITNGLGIRLGDAGFAEEIYDDLRQQAVGMPERLHNAQISIRLSPLPMGRGTPVGRASLFFATIRWEYDLIPTYSSRRFVCLSDIQEFRELRQDTTATSAWYVGPRTGLDAADTKTFELLDFTVDGTPRPIRRSSKRGSQTYSVNLGQDAMTADRSIAVAYTYRTLISADEHLLQLRVDQPTQGLDVELDYGDTDIEHVNVLDFIASSERTTISRSSADVPGRTVSISFDGWVFPRSGVAFVWSGRDHSRPVARAQ